jgi:predicted transcriptional regulator
MITWLSMALSDRETYRTLTALIDKHGENAIITQAAIAEASGLSIRTVQYSLHRLKLTGKIAGHYTPRLGYRYRICDGSPAQANS